MDAFISYSNADRKIARETKSALEDFGITSFLAHEDLRVSEEWRDSIIEQLASAQIFIALLSKNFKTSEWCAQEVGFIISRPDVLVIPLSLDGTVPYGFISKLQSKRVRAAEDIPVIIQEVFLKKKPRLAIPLWIRKVEGAGSFRGAEAIVAPLVPHFPAFTAKEVEAFLVAALGNSQVWDASLCRVEYLPAFARKHWAKIPQKLRKELLKKLDTTEAEIKTS